MKKLIALVLVLVMATALFGCSTAEKADVYPNTSVKMVVPFSAGGGTDLVGRAVADALSAELGQPVVVENVTGGSGMVGTAAVINAKADGYTLLFGTVEVASLPAIGQAPAEVKTSDLTPVYLFNADPACISVSVDSPYQTIEDLIEAAKNAPETISIGNGGAGGSFHLAAVSMGLEAGAEFLHVPSADGTNAAVLSCVGGFVDAVVSSPAEVQAQVEAGTLRILAIASDERLPGYEEVPTLKESGIDVALGTWRGLFVPKDTPAEVVSALEAACTKAAESQAFKDFMATGNYTIDLRNTTDFSAMVEAQVGLYTEVGKTLNLG